jgi:hypothetical protein
VVYCLTPLLAARCWELPAGVETAATVTGTVMAKREIPRASAAAGEESTAGEAMLGSTLPRLTQDARGDAAAAELATLRNASTLAAKSSHVSCCKVVVEEFVEEASLSDSSSWPWPMPILSPTIFAAAMAAAAEPGAARASGAWTHDGEMSCCCWLAGGLPNIRRHEGNNGLLQEL